MSANNRVLWGIRLYYFAWLGSGGFLLPFINLFYIRQGLTGAEVGSLSTVGAIVTIIVAPLWGRWSDSTSHPRRLLQISLLGLAVSYVFLSQQTFFWPMAMVTGLLAIIGAGVGPLSDSLTLAITGANKTGYGSVRLWGSLGWAIMAYVSGLIIERSGLFAAFAGYAAGLGLSIVILSMARVGEAIPTRPTAVRARGSPASVFRNPALLALAISLGLVLLAGNPQVQFEPVYLDQLGASEGVIGFASTIGALVELPAMLWADRLIRKYGPGRIFQIFLVMKAAILGVTLLAPNVPMLIAMRAANGVAFSFFAVSQTMLVAEQAAPEQRTTALAVFSVTLPALIRIASGPLGGLAFDAFGAYWLYAIAMVGHGLAWVALRVLMRRGKGMAAGN
jgi:MFS transporter, PPP family, 3-phenylpropionic acid transporter